MAGSTFTELGECALGANVALAVEADDGGGDLAVTTDHKLRGNADDVVELGRSAIVEGGRRAR